MRYLSLDINPSVAATAVSLLAFGKTLPTLFASNSTKTALGCTSLTNFPATCADSSEMCAVPRMWMIRDPRYQLETWGSQSAELGGGGGVSWSVSALDGLVLRDAIDATLHSF